ncbi:MAG TPA: PT domain-containing protein [Anaerolineae bacterium]|nr:PT domain-containing protein [Anaerolineae bacterium]
MTLPKLVLALSTIVALVLPPAGSAVSLVRHRPPLAIPDRRFGIVETYDDPASAAALGAGWTRVRFPWADLQPNNDGEWNSAFFTDAMLAAESDAGREVIGMIVNTPFWALNDAAVPGVPRGLNLPESDPGNVWATFVRQIVARYAGQIDHWIIWNEPDIWDPAYPGRTWGGTVAEFFQLQRVAYNVAKATNPNAVVHLSAFTYFWDANYGRTPFFALLMDEIQRDPQAPAHNYYFDVASANLYFRVDNIYDLIVWHHGEMRARGFDKPIWLTETNAAPSSDPRWPVANPAFPISLEEQAAYIPQAFAMALAAGVDRIAVYKLIDTPGDRAANPEPFGLVRDDRSRRPAFTAFQVATNYLAGFTGATLDQRDDLYTQVTVQRAEATTTVLWTRAHVPVQVKVPARAAQAILADAFGGRQSIVPRDGVYTIDLPGCTQPTCAIGGAPRLIVEGAPAAAIPQATLVANQPTLELTIKPTNSSTIAPTVQPTDSPTVAPTISPTNQPTNTPTTQPAPTRSPSPTPLEVQSPTPTPTPTLTLTLTFAPFSPVSNADALLIALGLSFSTLLVAFLLVKLPSRPDANL